MDAKELMIGDIVGVPIFKKIDSALENQISFDKGLIPVKVNAISIDYIDTEFANNDTFPCYKIVEPHGIAPIPLTKEMLMSNGFDWKDDNRYFALWINDHEGIFVTQILDDMWNVQSQLDHFNISCNICYLHNLQHILRLCRLDNIADSFKIQ